MARIFLETAGTATDAHLHEAAQLTRAALNAVGLDAMQMLDGTGGIALLVPFDDQPNYNDVRIWLHGLANALATVHGGLFTTEPNTHGGSLVHIHVSHNAPGMFSVLPYSARGLENLPIALPIPWEPLDTISTASVTVADFPAHFAQHGDTLMIERRRIGEQNFSKVLRHPEVRAAGEPRRSGPIAAAMHILADGITRSADQILDEAVKNVCSPPTTSLTTCIPR